MSKILRKKMVTEVSKKLDGANNFLVIDYKGLKANQAIELRRELRRNESNMVVVKNSVAANALGKFGVAEIKKYFAGMSAIVYGKDPVTISKKIISYKEKNKALDVKCAYIEGKIVAVSEVKKLSEMPSREQLLGQVVGTVAAPMTGLVRSLNAIASKLVYAINAIKDLREKETRAIN